MPSARRIHTILGVFFAPAILMFAFSGAMQVFELHEARLDEASSAQRFVMHLAEVHRHQGWELRRRAPRPAPNAATAPREEPAGASAASVPTSATPSAARAQPRREPWAMRIFVALAALGLMTTAGLGIWMAWQVPRDRRLVITLLALGSLVPVVLLNL